MQYVGVLALYIIKLKGINYGIGNLTIGAYLNRLKIAIIAITAIGYGVSWPTTGKTEVGGNTIYDD